MPQQQFRLYVELDGKPFPFRVVADQRDLAAIETRADIPDHALQTRVRFLAWRAMVRAGHYTGTWEEFHDSDCVEAGSDEPEKAPAGAEDEQSLDPGLMSPGAVSTSPSPATLGSRSRK